MSRTAHLIAVFAVALVSGPVLAGDTLESIEQKITQQWEKHDTVSAKFVMTQNMETGGAKVESTTKGTYEYMKDGDRRLYRTDMTTDMVQSFSGQTTKSSSKIMMIDDGEFQHTLTEMQQMPQPIVMKAKSDPTKVHTSGKAMFDALREQYDLKVLPEKTVDGESVHVIQAVPKTDNPMGWTKFLYHFRQDTGMLVQLIGMDKAGKTVQEMTYTDIKLDGKIDRDRFKFKAPPGAQMMDMTQQG